jgi:hypothetical protein
MEIYNAASAQPAGRFGGRSLRASNSVVSVTQTPMQCTRIIQRTRLSRLVSVSTLSVKSAQRLTCQICQDFEAKPLVLLPFLSVVSSILGVAPRTYACPSVTRVVAAAAAAGRECGGSVLLRLIQCCFCQL